MLNRLIKLANKLDLLGEYDVVNELDIICREAAKWVDKRPELERSKDITGSEYQNELMWRDPYERKELSLERVEKELKPRPGETDPRRWLIDEKGTHEEDRSEPTPEEKLKKIFPGKRVGIDPGEELSEEDLPDPFLETRVEDIEDYRDPEFDPLVELMEKQRTGD